MSRVIFYLILCLLITSTTYAEEPLEFVDPMIGTTKLGNTYPAVCTPCGLCKWTPQTRAGEQKGTKPYDYQDEKIQGFRWTNFISGSAVPEYGSMTLMPMTGSLIIDPKERASSYSHANESAAPHRYRIKLDDYDIDVECTASKRAGFFRITFPQSENAKILIQPNNDPLASHTEPYAYIKVLPERNEIIGYNPVYRYYISTGEPAGFAGYFVARFNRSIENFGVWKDGEIVEGVEANGMCGAFAEFATQTDETIKVKIGCSFTGIDKARKNLDTEIPDWDFEKTMHATKNEWQVALDRIQIETPRKDDKIKFYTSLYHSLLMPRIFSDVDGSYPGFAGTGPRQEKGFTYYEDFSMWDTYRALHPLLLLIQPERVYDMVHSLLVKADQGGWLPIFPAWNSYTTEMIGDHCISMITDAYVKGYRHFDTEKALNYMLKNATQMPKDVNDYADGKGRRALPVYQDMGYIPLEHPVKEAFHQREQVSRTLEYAYDDFCLAQFAQKLGHPKIATPFSERAQNYRHVFDKRSGFVRGRTIDGYWDSPFDPGERKKYICEATPWVYTWYVPHDIQGLVNLMGGRKHFIDKLDTFFEHGFYAHDNEPSHQITYLYNFAGAPWKTQERVRQAMEDNYTTLPGGLTGNDDSGQMSAWYIFSAMGFYPVCPGTDQYIIGSPIFDKVTVHLNKPRYDNVTLTIKAEKVSPENKYIQSMTINGKQWKNSWFSHKDIEKGGEIVFKMGPQPNREWGSSVNKAPFSMSE